MSNNNNFNNPGVPGWAQRPSSQQQQQQQQQYNPRQPQGAQPPPQQQRQYQQQQYQQQQQQQYQQQQPPTQQQGMPPQNAVPMVPPQQQHQAPIPRRSATATPPHSGGLPVAHEVFPVSTSANVNAIHTNANPNAHANTNRASSRSNGGTGVISRQQDRDEAANKVLVTHMADEETEDGRIRNREAVAKIRDAWVYKQVRERVREFTEYRQVSIINTSNAVECSAMCILRMCVCMKQTSYRNITTTRK
jgi:hypothetical protein